MKKLAGNKNHLSLISISKQVSHVYFIFFIQNAHISPQSSNVDVKSAMLCWRIVKKMQSKNLLPFSASIKNHYNGTKSRRRRFVVSQCVCTKVDIVLLHQNYFSSFFFLITFIAEQEHIWYTISQLPSSQLTKEIF